MKWQLPAGLLLCLSQANAATPWCSTQYASTSIGKAPTSTWTRTVTVTSTSSTSTITTSTESVTTTYVTVVGKKTTTIPAGPKFTPLTSAPTVTSTLFVGKRSADNRLTTKSRTSVTSTTKTSSSTSPTSTGPASTSPTSTRYPYSVVCSASSTTKKVVTTTSTLTYTETDYSVVISTSHVATSSAYAACATNNVLTEFKDAYVELLGYGHEKAACDGSEAGSVACYNEITCCEGAQRDNASGYVFFAEGEGLRACGYLLGGFQFTNLYNSSIGYTIGNGPAGSGVFVHYVE